MIIVMMVSASVFNLHVALSACSLKSTIIIKKNQDPAQRDLQQMPASVVNVCKHCRCNLYEIPKGRERGKEGGGVKEWLGVINQNETSKMKPIILPAEIQEL